MNTEGNLSDTELEVVKNKLVGLDEVRKKLINETLDTYSRKINSLNINIRNLKLLKGGLTGLTILAGGASIALGSLTALGTIPIIIGSIAALVAGGEVVIEQALTKMGVNTYLNRCIKKRDLYNNFYSSLSYFRLTCLSDGHISEEEYKCFLTILQEHKNLIGKIQYGMDDGYIFTDEEKQEINEAVKERVKVAVDKVKEQVIKKKADKVISTLKY